MRFAAVIVFTSLVAGAVPAAAQVSPPAVPPVSAAPAALPAPVQPVERDPWAETMERWNRIRKVPKSTAIRIDQKSAKPNAVTPWAMEIVSEDETYLYLKNPPVEDPRSPMHAAWKYHEESEAALHVIRENEEKYFIIDPFTEFAPPPFTDRLAFEERSDGLPQQGRWQVGFATGDIDRDGRLDLVFPPARLGRALPEVFFGTETGWRTSAAVKWPELRFDYGDVGVADFDGDGNLDIVIACHFLRNYLLFGNGKGDFTRHIELPRVSTAVTSRALAVADFNGDKRPDIVFLSELDIEMGTNETVGTGLLVVCLNLETGWRAVDASGGKGNLFGDQIAVGDFDADGDADIVSASHKNINRFLVFTNAGDGTTWTANAPEEFPFRAYVRAVAAGDIDGMPGDEAVMGFFQNIQSGSLTFPRHAVAVYSFARDPGGLAVYQRSLADVDASTGNDYTCAALGDLDGDGRLDLVLGRQKGTVRIMLQGLDGAYVDEVGTEINLGDAYINSVAVVDLGDGRSRGVVIGATDGQSKKGGIRCFVAKPKMLDSPAPRR